jgi:stage III sporulation protein AE
MPKEFESVKDSLPDKALDALPEGVFSNDSEAQSKAVYEMTSPKYAFDLIKEITGAQMGSAARLFITVTALLILSSALNAMRSSISSASLGAAMRFCMTGAVMASIIGVQFSQLESVALFFERISSLMQAMIPVGSAVLAMGGNISTAAASSASLGIFLGVCETICAKTVIPVTCCCTALALCNTLSSEIGLRGFASAIRKTYTFILGAIMTLLIATLSSQTALTAAADSAGARAAKLLTSSAIPIVGGTVGDTLRTVAGGVSYLKSIVGISGIVFVVLLLLPVLISLVLTRLVFLLTSGVADMLGCETEGKLLSELSSVWGVMIAVVSMCAVMFIFALVIFVRITVAAA